MNEYVLTENLRAALLQYLQQKPYVEVANFIAALVQLQQVAEKEQSS